MLYANTVGFDGERQREDRIFGETSDCSQSRAKTVGSEEDKEPGEFSHLWQ